MQIKCTGMFFALVSLMSPALNAWQGTLLLEEGIGKLRGFTQTPKGGDYDTTSEERPSFKEIGHSYDAFFHAEAAIYCKYVWAFINYHYLNPEDETVLESDLLTHNRFIPSGMPFEMQTRYNW